MVKSTVIFILLCLILSLTACNESPLGNQSGAIPMLQYSDSELGLRGVRPFQCNPVATGVYDCTSLNPAGNLVIFEQLALDMSLDELIELFSQQVDTPITQDEPVAYQSAAFSWELYTLEAAVKDLGTEKYHIQIALASDQSRNYLIALATLPEDYQAYQKLYDSIYTHALYAFESLQ